MSADNVRALATRQTATVALRPDSMDTLTIAKMLAESGFFGEVKQQGQALAKILAGQELGMGPIASLMGVYYQRGKVSYSANIMAAAIKRSGVYTYRVRKHDASACEIEFFERGESIGTSGFTIEEARQAGIVETGGNWTKYPRNMLFARAMSNGCKWFCPDIFGGVTPYTPEEMGASVTVVDGEIVPEPETVPPMNPELCDADQWNRRWHVLVKGTRFEDDDTRHKFIAWHTLDAFDSLTAFLAQATTEEADALLHAVERRIAAEAKKARDLLVSQLEAAVVQARMLGADMDFPEDLSGLSDAEITGMIDLLAASIAAGQPAEAVAV